MFDLPAILINYLFVLASIILFAAPLYLLYVRRAGLKQKQFNRNLELFFESRYANYLVFIWALGEALVWFVIPEFLLLLLIFMRSSRKRQLLYYDIYGTVAGTVLAIVLHLPEKTMLKLPYIQPAMIEQAKSWYTHHGILGLFFQPFSGVPYKVFANLAPDFKFFVPLFLLVAVIVRVGRYTLIYVTLSSIEPALHRFVARNYIKLLLISTFIFSALLLRVYLNYGAGYTVK